MLCCCHWSQHMERKMGGRLMNHHQATASDLSTVLPKIKRRQRICPLIKFHFWHSSGTVFVGIKGEEKNWIHKKICASEAWRHGGGIWVISGLISTYLFDKKRPLRILRSCGPALSISPEVWTKTTGEAAFSQYGPRPWNSLPKGFRLLFERLKTALLSLPSDRFL